MQRRVEYYVFAEVLDSNILPLHPPKGEIPSTLEINLSYVFPAGLKELCA
ncbi:hypothetical protein [Pedobacter sp. Leaf176]|nr:hypothetical protein [Pedobacter sp. Leaf176]